MNSSSFARLLEPLRRRISMMLGRAIIALIEDKFPVQTLQIKRMRGEVRNGVERPQEYGFGSVPLPGCEALMASLDGEPGHAMVINTNDRRYRPRNQPAGSVQLYTSANRKDDADTEHHIRLDPKERHLHAVGKTIVIEADDSILFRTRDGKNFIRIDTDGIRLTTGGGFDAGGSDIRMQDGKIWVYAKEEYNTRYPMTWNEEPPSRSGGTRGPTMPE